MVDVSLPPNKNEDYIVLEEENFVKGRIFGLLRCGGSINLGHFTLKIITEEGDNTNVKFELGYMPKGSFNVPKYNYKPKPKKKPILSEKGTKIGKEFQI